MPERITLTQADFSDGPDNGSSISAGATPGEMANAEVGATGQLADYDGVQMGQPATNNLRDVAGNEAIFDLRQNATTDLAADTQIRFAARKRQDQGGMPLTKYYNIREARADTNAERRPQVYPSNKIVTDGRLVTIQVRNPSTAITPNRDRSTLSIPAIGYDKQELGERV